MKESTKVRKQSIISLLNVRVQVRPSPECPALHVHRYEPAVFAHSAFTSQGPLLPPSYLLRHSSISVTRAVHSKHLRKKLTADDIRLPGNARTKDCFSLVYWHLTALSAQTGYIVQYVGPGTRQIHNLIMKHYTKPRKS